MKKTILNKFLLGSLILVSISCTDKYLDINSDPYQPGSLENDDYALGSAMTQLASCVVSSDVNTAQFTDCLLGGPMGDILQIRIRDFQRQFLISMLRMTGHVYF